MVIDRNKHNKYSTNQIYSTQSQQQQTEQAGSGSSSSTTIIYQGGGSGLTEEQKKKLDSIEEGAQVNQNAFSKVTISDGSITNEITANNPSDNVTFQGVSPIKLSLIDGVIQISYEGTSLWQLDEDGNLWTDRNVYSTKEISAYGYGEGEQPTGAQYLYELKDVDSVTATSPIDKGILQYNSTTRKWIVTDGSNIKPDLTGYATQSWVTQQLNLLVGSAPDVLDTIYEIAEALNNDPDYVKDIANNLSNLTNRVVKLEDMFEWDGDKIKAKADLYGVGEISAYGYGSGEAPTGAQYLHELKDVTLTEITAGQLLQWDGLKWVNINKDEVGLNESELDQFLIDNNYAKISDITWSNVSNKPDSFTTSISDIIDLNHNWYTILNTTPKDYITRWPQFSEITNRPNTLEGYGITDGVNSVILTGSGNAVTTASINGHVITLTKGSTFSLSTHNHDSIYVNVTGDTMTGNLTLPIVIVNTRIQLGDAYLEYDSENKAIKLCYKDDTQTVNFYATGEISAYGCGNGTPSSGVSYLYELLDVSLTNLSTDDMLKWNGDKWINIPMSTITPDLSWSNITDKPTTLSGYGITDAVTIGTAQTITAIKNHTKPISFKLGNTDDGIRFINTDTGGNGTGLYLLNGSGAKIAGIGFMTSSVDSYGYSFIGWGSQPWDDSSNFSVSNSRLQYKTYPILHTGNYSSTLDTRYVKKAGDTMTGPLTITSTVSGNYNEGLRISLASSGWATITFGSTGTSGAPTNGWTASRNDLNQFIITPGGSSNTTGLTLNSGGNMLWRNNTVWHAGNDGSGSGLDADLLDGYNRSNLYTSESVFIDATGRRKDITVTGDANTYYPVAISISGADTKVMPQKISVYRNLGETCANYSGNHSNGTSSMWIVYEYRFAGWDGNGGFIRTTLYSMPYANLCAKTEVETKANGHVIIYLRGGGTLYHIASTGDLNSVTAYYNSNSNVGTTSYPTLVSPTTSIGNKGIYSYGSSNSYINIAGNAATATKLRTARTIWGQSFDGTENVSGALTGVTSITASGAASIHGLYVSNSDSSYIISATFSGNVGRIYNIADDGSRYGTLYIGNTAGTALSISSTYNVGIGITSPSYKLHVNGHSSSWNFQAGTTITSVPSTFQTTLFGSNNTGYRFRVIRTDVSSNYFSTIYSPMLTFTTSDTHGYISMSYLNPDRCYVGAGSSNKLNWSAKLFNDKMNIYPATTNTYSCGTSSLRWSNVYSVLGNFSGTLSANALSVANHISATSLELGYSTPFIDFHFNNSTADYTSRIIENTSGTLTISGGLQVNAKFAVPYNTASFGGAVTMSSSLGVSGTLTASNGILTNYTTGTWLSMATRTDLIYSSTNQATNAAHALYRVKNSNGDAIVFGGLGVNVGFYGFKASTISAGTNGQNWNTIWNVETGALHHNRTLSVSGATTLGSTLSVTGRSTLSGGITVGYSNTSYLISTSSFICSSWIRTAGNTGWYNESYGGGMYMTDDVYVRVYNNKQLHVNNNIVATGEVTAYSSSDIRLKTNLKELKAINTLRKINTFEYDWTEEALSLKTNKNKHDYGIIAQELMEIIPEAITTNMYDKGYYGIDYVKLIPFTISAIKEVDDEVIILKKRVKELEDRLSKYESNIK